MSVAGLTTQSSVETQNIVTNHALGNFWPKDDCEAYYGIEIPLAELTYEENADGAMVAGVLRPRDKDPPLDKLPQAVWQVSKNRTRGVKREKVEDRSDEHARADQG